PATPNTSAPAAHSAYPPPARTTPRPARRRDPASPYGRPAGDPTLVGRRRPDPGWPDAVSPNGRHGDPTLVHPTATRPRDPTLVGQMPFRQMAAMARSQKQARYPPCGLGTPFAHWRCV